MYSTALIPRNLGLALTALPPGLDGLSRFIVHGIDLMQRIDSQLGITITMKPDALVTGGMFFLSPADFDFVLDGDLRYHQWTESLELT